METDAPGASHAMPVWLASGSSTLNTSLNGPTNVVYLVGGEDTEEKYLDYPPDRSSEESPPGGGTQAKRLALVVLPVVIVTAYDDGGRERASTRIAHPLSPSLAVFLGGERRAQRPVLSELRAPTILT